MRSALGSRCRCRVRWIVCPSARAWATAAALREDLAILEATAPARGRAGRAGRLARARSPRASRGSPDCIVAFRLSDSVLGGGSVKIPTPLKGWRVFAGEVGVIVLGVLLALGAQEIVEDLQMRADVREFRRSIDHEIGLNLFAYEVRSRGSACNEKRIKDLIGWVKAARDGQDLPQIFPRPPMMVSTYRSAWDNRDGNVFSHVPAKTRQKYAEFYDELENNLDKMTRELDVWLAIQRFAIPGPVSIEGRRDLYGHLLTALVLNAVWGSNMEISKEIAGELGVKPVRPDSVPERTVADAAKCHPIFPEKAGS